MADPDKRNAILSAAGTCFAQFGFSKTTMDDIGSLVGLNKASLYYYYNSKEAIFCEIIHEEGRHYLECLTRQVKGVPVWDKKLMGYFLGRLKFFNENTNLRSLSFQAAHQLKHQPMFQTLSAGFADKETRIIEQILEQGQAAGDIKVEKTRKTARILLAVANSFRNDYMEARSLDREIDEADYRSLMEDTRFALALILDGMKIGS